MSRRLVERVSRIVDRRAARRGFLSRSAVGATALAVAPAAYAMRPTTAYAAICNCSGFRCNCSQTCCDGYTDFCCLLTGENLCPPGTVVAGWWKADGSGYCDLDGPRPRYYMDCNRTCPPGCGCGGSGVCSGRCSGASCGCAQGSCNNRKADCTLFRYGQCSQDITCVGPILCRVITCVPPWQFDGSCSTATARDNKTRFHDRPCLHDGFTDIPPAAFYKDAVDWMIERGITSGFNDDLFGPAETVDRAQMVTFMWRYRGSPPPSAPGPFVDVATSAFYADAVAWAVEGRITTGITPDRFGPDATVTRAEAVTFLWRLAGEPSTSGPASFVDVPASAFYADAVAWAVDLGITIGIAPDRFGPDLGVTRGEAAMFLHRYHSFNTYVIDSAR